jgi:hypothetical protein
MEHLKATDYVEIVNNSTSSVSIATATQRVSFNAPTPKVPMVMQRVKRESLVEMFSTPGVERLFTDEILLIKDREMREFLGLPELDRFTIGIDEIPKVLDASFDNGEFEELLQYCSDSVLENIVKIASELPIKDMSKNLLIKKYSNLDPYKIFSERDEVEAPTGARKPVDGSAAPTPTSPGQKEGRVVRRAGS